MSTKDQIYVDSEPYLWPFDGNLTKENTCIIVIDMQEDFCAKGGYVDSMGYDLSLTRAPIVPIQKTLTYLRKYGFHILHTREGHR
jgi:nicotinamidase-related amidase